MTRTARASRRPLEIPPALLSIPEVESRPQAPLAPLTTFRIGGPADLVLVPESRAGLEAAIRAVRQCGIDLLVIGAGSNLLIAEEGFRGVAVKIGSGLMPIRVDGDRMIAAAGRTLPELMRRARKAGLSGLEFAGGIPGSLGGSLKMNAGAWQHEMSEIADWVIGVNEAGETVRYEASEIVWSYRKATFPLSPFTIVEAALRLTAEDPVMIAEREESWHEERRRTQPLGASSAGCVFKNPPGAHASQLIDSAGLKGDRVGGAMISPIHANFIVNAGGATADQVLKLIDLVRARVSQVHGVELELEVQLVGLERGEGGE
jgi:UDP-N-acetylmuramate dehydrogenase